MYLRYRVPSVALIILVLALFLCVIPAFAGTAYADTAVVSSSTLNIRTGPGTGYSIITQVGLGDRLPVLEQSGDWYCVTLSTGQKGWLAGWLVNIEKPQAAAVSSTGQVARVNSSSVNIRSGPGTGYDIITQAGSGSVLPIIGTSGDWYKVSLSSGGSGWIAGWLVTVVISPASEPSRSASEDTADSRNAVVTGSSVNVRVGPGTTNSVISQVTQGASLPVLEQSGDWYRVKLQNGSTGWVAGWLVSMNTPAANPPAQQSGIVAATPVSSAVSDSLDARGISLDVSEKSDKTTAVITANAPFEYSQFFLANPDRLVVDLKGIAVGGLPPLTSVSSDTIRLIRTGYFQKDPDITRVVFELLGGAQYDISISGDSKNLTVQTYIPDTDNSYSGKIIAIDAGHGSPDPGCIGKMGTKEKDVTLDIAKRVERILDSRGATVVMTRTGDKEVESLVKITDKANKANANVFVSIHINAAESTALAGTMTFVHSGSSTGARIQESNRLAKKIQGELVNSLGLKNDGVRYANFAVLRTTKMPAVLCELAFMSNPAEEKKLNTDDFRNKAAEAIVKGIGLYFSERRNA
jgi:N-acetylmuramoyl-L-alanine amidase